MNAAVRQGRKSSQRERLVRAVVEVSNRSGYSGANVSALIGEAGVSRPTFYEFFEDRDESFLAAIADSQQRLSEFVQEALGGRDPDGATAAAVEAIVAFASSEPSLARFLMSEAMAGGPRALDARDRGIAELADALDQARAGAQASDLAPDVDHRVLIGAIFRVLATRLRRREPGISRQADDLLGWVRSYRTPVGQHRWGKLVPAAPVARSPFVPDVPIEEMPGVLPRGRPRLSEEEIAENHRLRILYATALMAERKGYTATTVADISKLAHVDGHVFYRLFTDKQDAFMSVHELGFQVVMEVISRAFFSAKRWPQRSWEAGRALTWLMQANPLIAHIGFVESHAVGRAAVQRVEDSHVAFTFFLQEGLVYRKQKSPPTPLAMEAIITSIFEIVYRQSRVASEPKVASMLQYIAHLWLTPFLGAKDADAFIDRQLYLGED